MLKAAAAVGCLAAVAAVEYRLNDELGPDYSTLRGEGPNRWTTIDMDTTNVTLSDGRVMHDHHRNHAAFAQVWYENVGIDCPQDKFLYKSNYGSILTGQNEYFCLDCPSGKYASVGANRCHNAEWAPCSHTACKYWTHDRHCQLHSMTGVKNMIETETGVFTAPDVVDRPRDYPGKHCDKFTGGGQILQHHTSVFHDWREANGDRHKCRFDRAAETCHCMCK